MSLRKRRYTATKPKKRSSNIHELTKWVGDVRKWQKVEKTVGKMQLMKWELVNASEESQLRERPDASQSIHKKRNKYYSSGRKARLTRSLRSELDIELETHELPKYGALTASTVSTTAPVPGVPSTTTSSNTTSNTNVSTTNGNASSISSIVAPVQANAPPSTYTPSVTSHAVTPQSNSASTNTTASIITTNATSAAAKDESSQPEAAEETTGL